MNDTSKEANQTNSINPPKSPHAIREEKILAYWKDNDIFEKSQNTPPVGKAFKGEYIFYEGPPTANGRPGIHHLEARAFKDVIPRYKTMCGYHVRRKGGWDTHGLPVELQVEKELGLKSKKDIEVYGISAFNKKCKESVWTYVQEWERFTERIGYWVDMKDPYITYKTSYIESVWNIMKTVGDQDLLYKDYKVVPWCPRCGTGLSSHELAQGYQDVKDLSVTVKFKVTNIIVKNGEQEADTFLLAWTTTPWTLPGNVALAVNEKIDYVKVKTSLATAALEQTSEGQSTKEDREVFQYFILAKDRFEAQKEKFNNPEVVEIFKGKDLIGVEYAPLYPFIKENVSGEEKDKLKNAYKVHGADFVTTTDGTGIVHTAVMYGEDDFELGTKVGLPKYHLVNIDGTFKKETGFLAGRFVKDEATDVEIIKDLANRADGSLLFSKEKYQHSYPFCWRCHTPLIYFARDSWYIRMSDLRKDLIKENESINWEPAHIKEGRFGEWLREVKDWAISRERYWGTPLPVWTCEACKKWKVIGSVADVSKKPQNEYFIMRHGLSENNVLNTLNSDLNNNIYKLADLGRTETLKTAKSIKGSFDFIFCSPLLRARETAEIVATTLGFALENIIVDERLSEIHFGQLDGKHEEAYSDLFADRKSYFTQSQSGTETRNSLKRRTGLLLEEIESKYKDKKILIVSHDGPLWMMSAAAQGCNVEESLALKPKGEIFLHNSEIRKLDFVIVPHDDDFEVDLHRPYIDEVRLPCSCGGEMNRVKEVIDVWFDSGAMPFAEDHYPFLNKKYIDTIGYPADFISEAIDQTRGWFYTLHAIGVLMGKGKAYKNVICLGHILDEKGKKMSKSIGNVINPWETVDRFGADALRLWMYSVNQPGDSKNFDPKTVDEINKKIFNLAGNVLAFFQLYVGPRDTKNNIDLEDYEPKNILDKWILSRQNQLIQIVSEGLDKYKFFEPTRAIRDFIGDLSQWYLRRSRDRFKAENDADRMEALCTTRLVLITLSKVMAPFTPFFAEYLYQEVKGDKESVHLESWPTFGKIHEDILEGMEKVRIITSKGLEARMSIKINVRQPLSTLRIKDSKALPMEYEALIRDEVNVKSILWDAKIDKEVELDTIITGELKEEGEVRELLRRIQDLRKERGLKVNDIAVLIATEDLKSLIGKNIDLIKNATKLSAVEYGTEFGLKI